MYKLFTLCIYLAFQVTVAEKKEGDSCVEAHTGIVGRCASTTDCVTAREDFELNGIRPTFCEHSLQKILVCCRDGSSILKTSKDGGVNDAAKDFNDTRRVSERKCAEYSRVVVQTFTFLPLLPVPEVISLTAEKCVHSGVQLIVGGEQAILGEFPHMAAVGWADYEGGYTFSCGGSLISPSFVLTAGHCTFQPRAKDPRPVIVRLGDLNLDPAVKDGANPVEVPIKEIHKHPDYKAPRRYNDIALLELAGKVDLDANIRPACLWTKSDFASKTNGLATGWGVVNPDSRTRSDELMKVSLSLLDNDNCDKVLERTRNRLWMGIVPSQMCAGELRGGKDTCQGDSGSPLQVTSDDNQCIFHVIGVTSFGGKCAERGHPAVYTRVSSYIDWIESVVWPGQ